MFDFSIINRIANYSAEEKDNTKLSNNISQLFSAVLESESNENKKSLKSFEEDFTDKDLLKTIQFLVNKKIHSEEDSDANVFIMPNNADNSNDLAIQKHENKHSAKNEPVLSLESEIKNILKSRYGFNDDEIAKLEIKAKDNSKEKLSAEDIVNFFKKAGSSKQTDNNMKINSDGISEKIELIFKSESNKAINDSTLEKLADLKSTLNINVKVAKTEKYDNNKLAEPQTEQNRTLLRNINLNNISRNNAVNDSEQIKPSLSLVQDIENILKSRYGFNDDEIANLEIKAKDNSTDKLSAEDIVNFFKKAGSSKQTDNKMKVNFNGISEKIELIFKIESNKPVNDATLEKLADLRSTLNINVKTAKFNNDIREEVPFIPDNNKIEMQKEMNNEIISRENQVNNSKVSKITANFENNFDFQDNPDNKNYNKNNNLSNIELNELTKNNKPENSKESVKSYNFNNIRLDEIARPLSKMINSDVKTGIVNARINLNPKSLGRVFVEINMNENIVKIEIKAQSRETVKLLENQVSSLKDGLRQQGIQTELVNIRMNEEEANFGRDYLNKDNRGEKRESEERKAFINSFRNNRSNELNEQAAEAENIIKYKQGSYIEQYI